MTVKRIAALLALTLATGAAGAAEIAVACGSMGFDVEICRTLAKDWSAKTGHKVRIFVTPKSSTDQLELYRRQFAIKSGELDILVVDVIWPAIMREHLIDLTPYAKGTQKEHFPALVANNTVQGKLLAMPWFTEAGLLYYRKDLLAKYKEKVPTTWEEMTATARRIQDAERKAGNARMSGFVFEGRAYEGLTCNALEWIASYGGGTVIDGRGKITINNPRAAAAFDLVAGWKGSISPNDVTNYAEEDARMAFQSGNAVFMRNWMYAWHMAQKDDSPVKGKIGLAALPHGPGGASAATLGGWHLAVSKYSAHPDLAADLVMFLSSKAMQKKRALIVGSLPTHPSLYRDPDVLKAVPYAASLGEAFRTAVVRPSTVTEDKYDAVSEAIWSISSAVMNRKLKGAEAVLQLDRDLVKVRRGPQW
ncbi:MAG: ABC transporter substrate-binding protein [Gammaproteobacteria bacterium]